MPNLLKSIAEIGLEMQGGSPCFGAGNSMDIANASLFLASDMASYITGATLMVDGGASYQAHSTDFIKPDSYDDIIEKYMSMYEY